MGDTECVYYGTGGSPLYDVALRELEDPSEAPRWRLENATCETDWLHAVDITPQGLVCMAGHRALIDASCDETCPLMAPWVRCLGPDYKELWSRSFDAGTVSIASLTATPDGGVILAGARHDATPPADGYVGAPWIAALDPAGALLWENSPPSSGTLRAVARGDDGVLVAVGDLLVDGEQSDLFAAAYSPEGAVLWTMFHDSAPFEAALDVAIDSLGRSWIVGVRGDTAVAPRLLVDTFNYVGGGGVFRVDSYSLFGTTSLVALADPGGALQWFDVPPAGATTWAAAVALLPGGDAIVGGELDSYAQGGGAVAFARYDPNGARIWSAGLDDEGVTALEVDGAGDVFAIGSGCRCAMKLNADGEFLWTETWPWPGLRSDAFALDPAGALVLGDHIESGWFYPPSWYPY